VLEAAVGPAGINEIAQRELVDVPQTLERARVDHGQLVWVGFDKDMDRVTDLVELLGHPATVSATAPRKRAAFTFQRRRGGLVRETAFPTDSASVTQHHGAITTQRWPLSRPLAADHLFAGGRVWWCR
jgi:hypothetical protein